MDLSDSIRLLGDILGDVLRAQESEALFETEERIRALAKARRADEPHAAERLTAEVAALSPAAARATASAFTVYFDLVNLAEETHRIRALRERARAQHPAPVAESIADAVAQLKARGVTPEAMARLMAALHVELVLTAHPTEAKRRTVLSKLQRIAETIRRLHDPELLPAERDAATDTLRAEITMLWLTDRARTARPAVTDEVRTGLYFVDAVLWEALPRIAAELDAALRAHYPGLAAPRGWLTLASWIGGDRDGNPLVVAPLTAETLRLHRGLAVERHRRSLLALARSLSVTDRRYPPPPALVSWLDARRPLPLRVARLEQRYEHEPYRLVLALIAADLEAASQDDMTARLLDEAPHQAYVTADQIASVVDLIAHALPPVLVHDGLATLRAQLASFGLHAMRLDVREDAGRLARAVGGILAGLGIDRAFAERDEAARTAILVRLLADEPPAASEIAVAAAGREESAEAWRLFRLLARTQRVYGREPLGAFIISMTRGAADVLGVLLLARWARCAPGLPIAPLFETLDDLDAAPRVLAELFALDVYRAHLAAAGDEQMVMIGYSDSNKDGGYLASGWALYQAQQTITRACLAHGIAPTIFHGRGGTVARGGGPAGRAIRAQPEGTVRGRFRLTEQGETIASRYADPDLAHRHLEQIVSAVLLASVETSGTRDRRRVAGGDGRDGGARPRRVSRARRGARVPRLLVRRHADRGDHPAAARLTAGGAGRRRAEPADGARDPVGVLVDAEPLQPAGLVRPGRGAGVRGARAAARHVRGVAVLSRRARQRGDVAAQGGHGDRRPLLGPGAGPRPRARDLHGRARRVRAHARRHPRGHRARGADGRRPRHPALRPPPQPLRGPAQLRADRHAAPPARAAGPRERRGRGAAAR